MSVSKFNYQLFTIVKNIDSFDRAFLERARAQL